MADLEEKCYIYHRIKGANPSDIWGNPDYTIVEVRNKSDMDKERKEIEKSREKFMSERYHEGSYSTPYGGRDYGGRGDGINLLGPSNNKAAIARFKKHSSLL